MIPVATLRSIARARLRDAGVLLQARRYDAAAYLCGYVVEIALKARICRTLGWSGFPETPAEFKGLGSLRTHDLGVLVRFSGVEERILSEYLSEWSLALNWDPDRRYKVAGSVTAEMALTSVKGAATLLSAI